MPRDPTRLPIILTLTLLALLLAPTHAKALPQGYPLHSAGEHPQATPGLLSHLWSFLSAIWGETSSGLDPNAASASTEPGPDTGSILDPDGRP